MNAPNATDDFWEDVAAKVDANRKISPDTCEATWCDRANGIIDVCGKPARKFKHPYREVFVTLCDEHMEMWAEIVMDGEEDVISIKGKSE
jgi:hypothetical protein